VQRLAHTHEHDVERPIVEVEAVSENPNLTGNLASGQVPDETHPPGQAKRTTHRAAHLRRNAKSLGWRVRDVYRLDLFVVFETQGEFLGPVFGNIAAYRTWGPDRELLGELRAERSAQVGHQRNVSDPTLPDPAEDLTRAKGRMTALGEPRLELVELQFREIHGPCTHDL
jgi:hypothetical protein